MISDTHEKAGHQTKLAHGFRKPSTTVVSLGDDCAAIPQEDGSYLLFAAEGIVNDFLEQDPWFAGYSAVMVNISDIYAMGGVPLAVTDVIYGKDKSSLEQVWEGMTAASSTYDVPIVGGHTCYGSDTKALAVSIVGHSKSLLTSFSAQPGQKVLMTLDLNGSYYKDYPFWNASTDSSPKKLRKKGTLLPTIAEKGLSDCAKDISMGGLLGTLAMLANSSKIGLNLHFDQLIPPDDGDWERWLLAFPSFGFVLTCDEHKVEEIKEIFLSEEITCEEIGEVKKESGITIIKDETPIKFL